MTFHVLSDLYISVRICSNIAFVCPYGFVISPSGQSSVIGTNSGSPYTVAEDEKIIFFTSFLRIASNKTKEPEILLE